MEPDRFTTYSLKTPRILRILSSALKAVEPTDAVRRYLPTIEGNVYGLGIGKASIPMLTALAESIPLSGGLVDRPCATVASRWASSAIERPFAQSNVDH